MSFTATVENDSIKLPPGVHLPDGTQVKIDLTEKQASDDVQLPPLHESLGDFVGCINTGLGDLAENHDHYLYGNPKRTK